MYKYIRKFDEFYLIDERTGDFVSHKGEKVLGIAVSVDAETKRFCLHKHGGYDWVKAWAEKAKAMYIEAGYQDIADEIRVVRVEHCLLEDLNKILDTSALPVKYLDRLETISAEQNETTSRHSN